MDEIISKSAKNTEQHNEKFSKPKGYNYFFCIDFNDTQLETDLRECIKSFPTPLDLHHEFGFNWKIENTLHLTLFYIGKLEKNNLKIVSENVKQILSQFKEFYVQINKLEVFKKRNNSPVVLIAKNYSNKNEKELDILNKIHEEIKNYMLRAYPESKDAAKYRKFIPHITIGRVKKIVYKKLRNILSDFFHFYSKQKDKTDLTDLTSTSELKLNQHKYHVRNIKLMHLDWDKKIYTTDYEFNLKHI